MDAFRIARTGLASIPLSLKRGKSAIFVAIGRSHSKDVHA
jgi:hypothetical protein